MNMYFIDKNFKALSTLNNCNSCVWTSKLWEHSCVAVKLGQETELPSEAWGIMRDDDPEVMRITAQKYDGESIEIEGTALSQCFEYRTVLDVQSFTDIDVSDVIKTLINNAVSSHIKMPGVNRSFSFIESMPAQSPTGKLITLNTDFGSVFDQVKSVIDDAPIRFYIDKHSPSLYCGHDVSRAVVFTETVGDFSGYQFTRNYLDYANMAVVCGSGEGSARIVALVDRRQGDEDLFELYVDDSSESTTNLVQKGTEELSKLPVVLALEATVASERMTYRKDYHLGDTVGYSTSQASGTDIVSEVEETFESGGYSIRISLGKTAPTIKEYIDTRTR